MSKLELFYAGIGSRKTPQDILAIMTKIAESLEKKGYILRSGGAEGADSAFELGIKKKENKEIFTWRDSSLNAEQIAKQIHPAWFNCNENARKQHGRNVMQVLGKQLDKPVSFVICWTPNAQDVGGTRTAIVLAKKKGIFVYNLADPELLKLAIEQFI